MEENDLKCGSVVRIDDYSYSYIIDGLNVVMFNCYRDNDVEWTIVSDECKLPADDADLVEMGIKKEYNDTIIKGNKTGRIVYTQKRFLCALVCSCCGHAL